MKVDRGTNTGSLRLLRRGVASAAVLFGLFLLAGAEAVAQENPVYGSAVTMSSGEATLELDLASGETRTISFRDGEVLVDGTVSGSYEAGGALERSWRELLRVVSCSSTRLSFSFSPRS